VLPLAYVRSRLFGNRLISLPFADYGGPCTSDRSIADKLIVRSMDVAREIGADFLEIRSPSERYFDFFDDHKFIKRDDYVTFILSLDRSIDDIWKSIDKENRTAIRKAKKNEIQIVDLQDKSQLKAFYDIYLKTMKRLGSPPQKLEFFNVLWDHFYPRNLKVLMSSYHGEFISGALFFLHQNTIHYAYGGLLNEHANLRPNNLLFWTLIEWGNANRYDYLDFGRTRQNSGVYLFKKKWGGKSISMPYFYRFYNRQLTERQEIKYKNLSELWSRYLPEVAANFIGPKIISEIG